MLAHAIDMELPVVAGEWKCAALLRANPARSEPIIAGCAVWSSALVGSTAKEMARLIAEMEDMGAGPICNVGSDDMRAYGLRFIGRYRACLSGERTTDTVFQSQIRLGLLHGGCEK